MSAVKYGVQDEAKELAYDNSTSGLAASTLQQAVDLLQSTKEPANSNILKTTNIGVSVQAYNANLTGINQGLATTSNPTFGDVLITSLNVNNNFSVSSAGVPSGSVFTSTITEAAHDAVAGAFASGTHSNITVGYNDAGNSLSLTVANNVGIIKSIHSANIASSSGTTTYTPGTTAPTTSGGTQIWTETITPASATSKFIIKMSVVICCSSANAIPTIAVFRGSTYIGAMVSRSQGVTNDYYVLSIITTDTPNTASAVTYSCRVGISGGTWYVNRRNVETTYGQLNSGWEITEF